VVVNQKQAPALLPYMSAYVSTAITAAARARGLGGDELRATVEAAEIAAALQALSREPPAPTASPQEFAAQPADCDVSREASWLPKIARAYATPLVRKALSTSMPAAPRPGPVCRDGLHGSGRSSVDEVVDLDVSDGRVVRLPLPASARTGGRLRR
jgi:hypothetical protein